MMSRSTSRLAGSDSDYAGSAYTVHAQRRHPTISYCVRKRRDMAREEKVEQYCSGKESGVDFQSALAHNMVCSPYILRRDWWGCCC